MTGVLKMVLFSVAVGTTSAAVALYPQPTGAKRCTVEGIELEVGDVIKPTKGPQACTRITCSTFGSELLGQQASCGIKEIQGPKSSEEAKRIETQNRENRRKPYPDCCITHYWTTIDDDDDSDRSDD